MFGEYWDIEMQRLNWGLTYWYVWAIPLGIFAIVLFVMWYRSR